MAKKKIPFPCKCSSDDPEHTMEDSGDGWTRYVCSSCGAVKFKWIRSAAKDPKGF